MNKPLSLRAQLLLGLLLILPVVALSVGMITHWSTRQRTVDAQLRQAETVARATAALLASVLERRGAPADPRQRLQRLLPRLAAGSYTRELRVYDRRLRPLGGTARDAASTVDQQLLRRALHGREVVARLDEVREAVVVVAPLETGSAGAAVGALQLTVALSAVGADLPVLFWVLMAVDSLVLLLFVAVVVTRYVARPIEAMQRAAARVAGGDLDVQLHQQGAFELASLAASFNSMTAAMKRHLARLERQRQSLIHSEKLASIGRLAAGVAHEVGNPLQAIIGFTDILQQPELDEETRSDCLQRIQREAERIHGIIGGLLDYSRPMDDALEPVDVAAVLEQSLALLAPQKRCKDVAVRGELGGLPPVSASSQRLVQVFLNLLLNAADAMSGAGEVDVDATVDEDAGILELRVANGGPAIPAADRVRIFDPFFTTKDPGQGTGLGLAVSQSIVESFGGRLQLADDERTTFVLALPLWREEPGQSD